MEENVGHVVRQNLTLQMSIESFQAWRQEFEYGYGLTVGIVDNMHLEPYENCLLTSTVSRVDPEPGKPPSCRVCFSSHISKDAKVRYEDVQDKSSAFDVNTFFDNSNRVAKLLARGKHGWETVHDHLALYSYAHVVDRATIEQEKGKAGWHNLHNAVNAAGTVTLHAHELMSHQRQSILETHQPKIIEQVPMGRLLPEDSPFPYTTVHYHRIDYDRRHHPQLWDAKVLNKPRNVRVGVDSGAPLSGGVSYQRFDYLHGEYHDAAPRRLSARTRFPKWAVHYGNDDGL